MTFHVRSLIDYWFSVLAHTLLLKVKLILILILKVHKIVGFIVGLISFRVRTKTIKVLALIFYR